MTVEAKTFRTADADDEYTFLFDIDGLIAAEDCANMGSDANVGIKQIIVGASRGRLGYLVALVYGGLKANHPAMTRAEAWALIDGSGPALGEALWPALFAAMPEAKAGKNPRKAGGGTGSRSSPPGSRKGSTKRASGNRHRGATKSS